jgi:hypothetical protein
MAGADISFAQRLRSLALKEEAKKRRQAKKDAKVSTRGVASSHNRGSVILKNSRDSSFY